MTGDDAKTYQSGNSRKILSGGYSDIFLSQGIKKIILGYEIDLCLCYPGWRDVVVSATVCMSELKLTIWVALFQRVGDGIFASHMWNSSLQSLYTHFSLCSTAWDYSYFWFFSLSPFLIQSFDFLSVTPVICQFCFPRAFKFVWCVMNNFFLMFCDRTFLG